MEEKINFVDQFFVLLYIFCSLKENYIILCAQHFAVVQIVVQRIRAFRRFSCAARPICIECLVCETCLIPWAIRSGLVPRGLRGDLMSSCRIGFRRDSRCRRAGRTFQRFQRRKERARAARMKEAAQRTGREAGSASPECIIGLIVGF